MSRSGVSPAFEDMRTQEAIGFEKNICVYFSKVISFGGS